MKPVNLYLKSFLYFVVVVKITLIMILVLFLATAGRIFRERYQYYTQANILLFREYMQKCQAAQPKGEKASLSGLQTGLDFLARTYGSKVWLSREDGAVLLKTFPGPPPPPPRGSRLVRQHPFGPVELIGRWKRGPRVQARVPLVVAGRRLWLHSHFQEPHRSGDHAPFFLGMIVIGLLMALMVLPFSRLITRRVGRLKASALRIAHGDLDHRARPAGRDEIGQLAEAFNHMADHLQEMILASRELTANLSHQLRTPLARMQVAGEMLAESMDKGDTAKARELLQSMAEDLAELDLLIGRMLKLSKLDLQAEPLDLKALELAPLLEELLTRFGPLLQKSGVRLLSHLAPGVRVRADRAALSGALANLLDNAVKFTPAQGMVEVSLTRGDKGALIEVANSSPPLDQAEVARLFEPFYRRSQAGAPGSGLGLAIARKVIERHKGAISAEYSSGRFVVRVSLPAT